MGTSSACAVSDQTGRFVACLPLFGVTAALTEEEESFAVVQLRELSVEVRGVKQTQLLGPRRPPEGIAIPTMFPVPLAAALDSDAGQVLWRRPRQQREQPLKLKQDGGACVLAWLFGSARRTRHQSQPVTCCTQGCGAPAGERHKRESAIMYDRHSSNRTSSTGSLSCCSAMQVLYSQLRIRQRRQRSSGTGGGHCSPVPRRKCVGRFLPGVRVT